MKYMKRTVYDLVPNKTRGALDSLRKYMESPERSYGEFLIGNSDEIRKILKSPEFIDELKAYLARIKVNKDKGLDITIKQGDIYEFMRASFTKLDDRAKRTCFLEPVSKGRRVYTGQTEQPGPNPGFY